MTTAPPSSHHGTLIPTTDLNPSIFAVFGQVIQNPSTHNHQPSTLQRVAANQGTADKWLDITHMHDWYASRSPSRTPARCVMNMFVCKPRALQSRGNKRVFPVKVLERHPYTPQTFIPLGLAAGDEATRYLVVVAPTLGEEQRSQSSRKPSRPSTAQSPKGPGLPDLNNVHAFLARGDQAVTYGPGTWHAPMVVLGERPIDFVVVQYANGVGDEDCQEVDVPLVQGGGAEVDVEVSVDGVVIQSSSSGVGLWSKL